ncbi:MAG: extracellular solute-binding protein [Clostridiales bacterium]|jgi:ABC-type glycerol-3-phosphate transport system substrate-binding protein|nr:extracellular solute-binding protein [Clostridiales bacterium]
MKSKRLTAALLTALFMIYSFTACSQTSAGNTPAPSPAVAAPTDSAAADSGAAPAVDAPANDASANDAPVEISIANWPQSIDAERVKMFEGYVATMKERYPNITIVPNEYAYTVDSFLPKAASGQLPTLYSTFFTETDKIIGAGYAADITDVLTELGYVQKLNPDMLALLQRDGRTYGVPNGGYNVGMAYNVSIFKEAGLVDANGIPLYPQTYEELAETAKTIKEKTGKTGLFWYTKNNQGGWMFMNLAWSYGVEFMKQENGKWISTFDSEEAVSAMQYVKDLKWKHNVIQDNLLVDGDDMFNMFGTNQVAMAYSTLDWNDPLITQTGMNRNDLSLSRVPAGPVDRVSLMGGNCYMFNPSSTKEQIEAAFKWLEVTGFSPEATELTQKGLEEKYENMLAKNLPVGPMPLRIWQSGDIAEVEEEIVNARINVDMNLWNEFCDGEGVTIHPEVPMNAQELYKAIDNIVQAVLTDENADIRVLLSEANATFQKDYLDNAQ